MSFPRLILLGSVVLFAAIGILAVLKKTRTDEAQVPEVVVATAKTGPQVVAINPPRLPPSTPSLQDRPTAEVSSPKRADFPAADRIHQLFSTRGEKLPIVETLSYTSRVEWLKGRPAWIADYAKHYSTSRHFIARSLNEKSDYLTQKVSSGSRFNVFRIDKEIQFYLLIDTSRCKMALYCLDVGTQERVLLKTYDVGLGRKDPHALSGCLTPLGVYSLGNKVGIYSPGIVGTFMDRVVEMIQVFGTRWIPFDREFEGCSAAAKGYGLHGTPFVINPVTGRLEERKECVGTYDSDGCIRLLAEDMEEVFAIVITKPSFVVIVRDYTEAHLPGVEVAHLTH